MVVGQQVLIKLFGYFLFSPKFRDKPFSIISVENFHYQGVIYNQLLIDYYCFFGE